MTLAREFALNPNTNIFNSVFCLSKSELLSVSIVGGTPRMRQTLKPLNTPYCPPFVRELMQTHVYTRQTRRHYCSSFDGKF
jgi:hypothetical protein